MADAPRPKSTRKGINSRDKGGRGENQVCALLKDWWKSDFARTPSSGGFKTKKFREDWNAEGDVVTPDETFPFSVEVKWQEEWTLDHILTSPQSKFWEWWEQAKRETAEGRLTLLVFKRNRNPWFVMMRDRYTATPAQVNFIKGSPIRVTDRQGESAYIRLFDDLLEEPKKLWERNPKSK
jgi:hypothetical protein